MNGGAAVSAALERHHAPIRRVVMTALALVIVLVAAYWALWFARPEVIASEDTQAYRDFENAFPLADSWLALCCLLALVHLARRSPAAAFWLIAAGSAGVFLGSMDLLYDIEHGVFTRGSAGAIEAAIVAATWVFSLGVLWWAWFGRAALSAQAER